MLLFLKNFNEQSVLLLKIVQLQFLYFVAIFTEFDLQKLFILFSPPLTV
jgi:hypothetical protein